MAEAIIRFEASGYEWLAERAVVLFLGQTDLGEVEFVITGDALLELLDPDLEAIDRETALEAFAQFESVIYKIARREFVSRLGGEPPILLTAADVSP